MLDEMEQAVLKKNSAGTTRTTELVEGLVSSVKDGFKRGLAEDDQSSAGGRADKPDLRGKLSLHEVALTPGHDSKEERVVGIVRNDSQSVVTRVMANLTFRDKSDKLIDVSGSSSLLAHPLKPGESVGFEIDRTLGDFGEDEAVLATRKAAVVAVQIVSVETSEK